MKVAEDGDTQKHTHTSGDAWQRTEESRLTIAVLLENCLHRENTLWLCLQPSITVNRRSSHHCLIVLCTDLLWTCTQLCRVSIGLRVDFGRGIEDIKRNHSTDWWKRQGGEEGGSLHCAPHPTYAFPALLKNILPSELPWGENGVPFHTDQGVV